ncbi:MAG: hypothetical protein JO262_07655 [Solirubrobacterales bacterium]|nr:hypothetical protein [Solirubrobacterales bacterium]MBV9941984.1 hypothetical protein [Solirubrobacterales bacterium]
MLLRRRTPQIDTRPIPAAQGFEHLAGESIAVLRWLRANQVEFVLVGPVAAAIRAGGGESGAVAIVPAPYRRNFERLRRALEAAHARPRGDGVGKPNREARPAKMTFDAGAGGERWMLGTGQHYLDVEGRPSGTPGYQELLYEAGRFELAEGLSVDVASPEDIEHYDQLRRTGAAPEMRITRGAPREQLEAH